MGVRMNNVQIRGIFDRCRSNNKSEGNYSGAEIKGGLTGKFIPNDNNDNSVKRCNYFLEIGREIYPIYGNRNYVGESIRKGMEITTLTDNNDNNGNKNKRGKTFLGYIDDLGIGVGENLCIIEWEY